MLSAPTAAGSRRRWSVSPVKLILSTRGSRDQRVADRGRPGRAGPMTHVRRDPGVDQDLAEQERRQRRELRRLEHDGVAAGQRRRHLPRRRSSAGSSTARSARRRRSAPAAPRPGPGLGTGSDLAVDLVGRPAVVLEGATAVASTSHCGARRRACPRWPRHRRRTRRPAPGAGRRPAAARGPDRRRAGGATRPRRRPGSHRSGRRRRRPARPWPPSAITEPSWGFATAKVSPSAAGRGTPPINRSRYSAIGPSYGAHRSGDRAMLTDHGPVTLERSDPRGRDPGRRHRHRPRRVPRPAGPAHGQAGDRPLLPRPRARRRRSRPATTCLTVDVDMNVLPGYEFANWEQGYGDFSCRPDLATLRLIPWLDGDRAGDLRPLRRGDRRARRGRRPARSCAARSSGPRRWATR